MAQQGGVPNTHPYKALEMNFPVKKEGCQEKTSSTLPSTSNAMKVHD